MAKNNQRFTIYDMMEVKGVFELNSANAGSPAFQGPVEYPKMLYHPEGKFETTVPAEIVMTPMGPKELGQQRELIHAIAANAEEEKALRAAGWHDHPAKAFAAAGLPIPAISPAGKIADLEAKVAALQDEIAMREANEADLAQKRA